jgi:hypothetical protein
MLQQSLHRAMICNCIGTNSFRIESEEQVPPAVLEPISHESAYDRYYQQETSLMQQTMPTPLDSDEDYNQIRGFARSSLTTNPYYSPWSTYLPSYSPTSPGYSPMAYTPAPPDFSASAPQHLIDNQVVGYAPTAPRYNPTSNSRFAPSTALTNAWYRPSREDRALHSRNSVDYFRLLSRASDTQHGRRMRADRDRFPAAAVGRAAEAEEVRATASRSRSREGGSACPSRTCTGVAPCSFLRPGMMFDGVQSSHDEVPSPAKEWSVTVEVTQVLPCLQRIL